MSALFAAARRPKPFDSSHPDVVAWAAKNSASQVVDISARQEAALRSVISSGLKKGLDPEEVAARVKSVIGLSDRDVEAVDRLREEGASRSEAKAYAEELLDARAERIAETEMVAAFEEGKRQSWSQAADDGDLPADAQRVWTAQKGCCDACDELDGTAVGLDEEFDDGVMAPPLHPHCACETELASGLRAAGGQGSGNFGHGGRPGEVGGSTGFADTGGSRAEGEKGVDKAFKKRGDQTRQDVSAALRSLGGPGSGNFGHSGRPGEVGGSGGGDTPAGERAIGTRGHGVRKSPEDRIPFRGGSPEYQREYLRRRRERLRDERARGIVRPPREVQRNRPRAEAVVSPARPSGVAAMPSRSEEQEEAARAQSEEQQTKDIAASLPAVAPSAPGEPRWPDGPNAVDLFAEGTNTHLVQARKTSAELAAEANAPSRTPVEVFSAHAAAMHPLAEQLIRDKVAIARDLFPDARVEVYTHGTGAYSSISVRVTTSPTRAQYAPSEGPDDEPALIREEEPGVSMTRAYSRRDDGTLKVEHAYFEVPDSMQGKGYATRMMGQSMEAYERAGVSYISVHANIDVGGHAWARQGFEANKPGAFRAMVMHRARYGAQDGDQDGDDEDSADGAMVSSVTRRNELLHGMKAAGSKAPAWLASQPEGKLLLLGSDWNGHIDLHTGHGKSVAADIKKNYKASKATYAVKGQK